MLNNLVKLFDSQLKKNNKLLKKYKLKKNKSKNLQKNNQKLDFIKILFIYYYNEILR